jgi:mannose-binding lectin
MSRTKKAFLAFVFLAFVLASLIINSPTVASPADSLYAEIDTDISVTSASLIDIPGLSFTLPARTSTKQTALIFLNVPNPYAIGNNFPGAEFGLNVGGAILARGSFTENVKSPPGPNTNRSPFTLIKRVSLLATPTLVRAQWAGIRGSTGRIDSFASLSAIISNSN